MDRSLAFTALLEFPGFSAMEARLAERAVTDMLAGYRRTGGYPANGTLYTYSRTWWPDSTYARTDHQSVLQYRMNNA